jgi:hypothetical protein
MIAERVSRHKFQSGKHCTKKDRLDERVDDVFRFTEIIQNNAGGRTEQHQLRVEQHHKGVTKTRLSVKNSRNNSQIWC